MEIRKATLRGFDSAGYKATVAIDGSLSTSLGGVPVARNIASGEMVTGRKVAIIFFDASDPNDAVVCAVWG